MRKLPLLLTLLLLSVLLAAASAQAFPLTVPAAPQVLSAPDEEEAEASETDGEEAEEEEFCTIEEEEEELCEEEEVEPEGKDKKADECLLKSAKAAVSVNPGKRRLRLTVHYKTLKPTTVNVETSLQGPKGTVHLGTEHARFRRSGVYRDTFSLPAKQAKKALAAREFSVELHVVNAPSSCDVELSGASPRARR